MSKFIYLVVAVVEFGMGSETTTNLKSFYSKEEAKSLAIRLNNQIELLKSKESSSYFLGDIKISECYFWETEYYVEEMVAPKTSHIEIENLEKQIVEERRKAKTAENFIKQLKIQIENTTQSRVQLTMIKMHLKNNN